MALREMKTLVDMRTEVLARCGLGQQGVLTQDLHPQIDAFLRQAQRKFWVRNPWLRNRLRETITLTEDVTIYDFPDDFDIGSIEKVTAVDENGQQWDLGPGITSADRTELAITSTNSGLEPSIYEITGKQIEVLRAPSDTVTSLIITGSLKESPLTGENDRPSVDDEACIMDAVIRLKKFKRMPVDDSDVIELENYISDVDGQQSVGRTFQMGSEYVDAMDEMPRNRQRPWWQANRRP